MGSGKPMMKRTTIGMAAGILSLVMFAGCSVHDSDEVFTEETGSSAVQESSSGQETQEETSTASDGLLQFPACCNRTHEADAPTTGIPPSQNTLVFPPRHTRHRNLSMKTLSV